jgi:hypothetical protein
VELVLIEEEFGVLEGIFSVSNCSDFLGRGSGSLADLRLLTDLA